MTDKSNLHCGDMVSLHGHNFIVANLYYVDYGYGNLELIDIVRLYKDHQYNLKLLKIDGISSFSVNKTS